MHPHRAHVHRLRRDRPRRVTEDQLGGPAADVDHQHRLGRRRAQVADGAVVGEGGLLLSRQHLGPDAEPGEHPVGEDVSVGGVARRRRRAEPHPASRDARPPSRRTRRSPRTRVPAPRRPAGRSRRRPGPAGRSGYSRTATSGQRTDQQLDGVGAAVEGRDGLRHILRHRAPPPTRHPAQSSTSSPSGFTPGPAARACAASTCRHFTRFGMPPAETPSISGHAAPFPRPARPGRRGRRVRRGVRRGECLVLTEPGLHLLHQARSLEGADQRGRARTGQVVRRRERRPVGQPRLRGDHVGQPARTAVADRVDGPRLPPELSGDRALVVGEITQRSLATAGRAPGRGPCRPAGRQRARRRPAGRRLRSRRRARPGRRRTRSCRPGGAW